MTTRPLLAYVVSAVGLSWVVYRYADRPFAPPPARNHRPNRGPPAPPGAVTLTVGGSFFAILLGSLPAVAYSRDNRSDGWGCSGAGPPPSKVLSALLWELARS